MSRQLLNLPLVSVPVERVEFAFSGGLAIFQEDDAGIGDGVKDFGIAEIDQAANPCTGFQERAKPFAVSRAHPFVGSNKAEDAAFSEELNAALVEVDVEVGGAGETLEVSFEGGLVVFDVFFPHVWWVVDMC